MLRELQNSWLVSLLNPETERNDLLADWRGGLRSVDAGFAVYVNNIRANALSALRQSFPATRALAGDGPMQRAMLNCLRHAPPRSGDLGEYGAALIDEIAYWVDSSRRSVVTEVARYEWTLDRLSRKSREPAWSLQAAANIDPQAWPQLRLRLVDHSYVFESGVAVRAWHEHAIHDAALPTTSMECVLLVAGDSDVEAIEIDAAEREFIRAMGVHRNLECALQATLTLHAGTLHTGFELQALLTKLFAAGALAVPDVPASDSQTAIRSDRQGESA